jgi:HK97 family phage portal protein
MSSFDFIYKIVSMLYTSNNAFIYIHTDDYGDVDGLYPIPYKNVSLLEAKGSYYVKFICNNAEIVRPYEEVIHLRRHFNTNDFMGDNQTRVLEPTLKLNDSVIESIVNGVKSSNRLQGLLKASTLVQETELKKKKDEFVENYLSLDNAGGIAILDNKYDFQQIKLEPVLIDEKQMEAVANDLLRYYGVSENIIKSEYTENEYGAFYNSVIETLAIQISQELTNKIFSKRDIREGAKIVLSAERMTFASLDTRVKAIETLMPLGIFSINESRKVMELSDIENGDKHLVSLNYVDLDKANKYQVGETEDDKE